MITHSAPRGGDDDSGDSLREQAWQGVMHAIQKGGYGPGDRLPPERELAETLGVSRSTLRLALHDLDRSGVIVRRPGRGGGTFVGSPKVDRDLGHFAGLAEYIRRQGLTAGARVISVALLAADSVVADALGADIDAPVVEIIRVRLADGEPIALERSYFSADRFPGMAEQPLGGSLYDLLREVYQDWPTRAVERLQPIAAEPADAMLLGVPAATPLLAVERVTHGREGAPIEYAYDLFRGDRTRVVVWTGPGESSIEEAGRG